MAPKIRRLEDGGAGGHAAARPADARPGFVALPVTRYVETL